MCRRTGIAALALLLTACGAARENPDPLADPRLSRPVRVHVEGMSLAELLPRLSAAAGLPLHAARETADEKVVVLGPARPLREVLADLAALLGSRWERRAFAGTSGFLLAREPAARAREEKLAASPEGHVLRHLDAQVRALREPRSRLERRPENDPIRRALLDPKRRAATQFFALLSARQRELLVERGRYRLFFPALPAAYQAAALALHRGSMPAGGNDAFPGGAVARRGAPPDADFLLRIRGSGLTAASLYPGGAQFAVFDVPASLPEPRGDPYGGQAGDEGPPLPVVGDAVLEETLSPVERLRRLAAAAGVPVLADFHRLTPVPIPLRESIRGTEAASRIDLLASRMGALWWRRGGTLLFRSRDWVRRREHELADRWLDEMVGRLKARREPTLADLLRLEGLGFRRLIGLQLLSERGAGLAGTQDYYQRHLSGVPEVLAILKGIRGGDGTPLVNWDRLDDERKRLPPPLSLRFAQMSARQRAGVLPLLAVQRREPDGLHPETFELTVQSRDPRPSKRRADYRYLPVELAWRTRGASGSAELWLPLAVPDDRRAGAVIQADPAGQAARAASIP